MNRSPVCGVLPFQVAHEPHIKKIGGVGQEFEGTLLLVFVRGEIVPDPRRAMLGEQMGNARVMPLRMPKLARADEELRSLK